MIIVFLFQDFKLILTSFPNLLNLVFSVDSGTDADFLPLFSEYIFFSSSLADCRAHLSNNIFRFFPMSSRFHKIIYYSCPAYGPSKLNQFPPPYPLSRLNPIISIAVYVCSVCPDHYKIANAQGTIHVGSLVQSHKWTGPLCVLWYMAQHSQDIVAESKGQDEHGEHIVRFLVVSHRIVSCPEDIIDGSGHSVTYFQYSPSLDYDHFIPCARPIEYLAFPAPLLPSDYSDDTLQY
jgi:hypothetical protein